MKNDVEQYVEIHQAEANRIDLGEVAEAAPGKQYPIVIEVVFNPWCARDRQTKNGEGCNACNDSDRNSRQAPSAAKQEIE